MSDPVCPFSATLARADYACQRASQVVRRGGAEFLCTDNTAHARCRQFFDACKILTLATLGLEDDLTQVPQGTLVKIQFGSLAGLQRITTGPNTPGQTVDNIDALLESAGSRFGGTEQIPCADLLDDIRQYRLARRSGRHQP